jgi:2-polyprenyl-3-methyl-5-hydroxy-6-metoxy-1,4-benzoquinol methylase
MHIIRKYKRALTSYYRSLKYYVKLLLFDHGVSNMFGLISKNEPHIHPVLNTYCKLEYRVFEIQQEVKIEIYDKNGNQKKGFHNYSNAWWYNLKCPYSFSYLNIDSLYPTRYFITEETGHPNKEFAHELYEYMSKVYSEVFKKSFTSILELGTGGGEITKQFLINNKDFIAVEGTENGVKKLINNGIPQGNILFTNLKKMKKINKRFDLVMCTEVAEHIEPFFASKIVENCINHSDVIWFSAANRKRSPHYHHSNEIGITAWDNIFAYFGFNFFIPLNRMHGRADRLYISSEIKENLIR